MKTDHAETLQGLLDQHGMAAASRQAPEGEFLSMLCGGAPALVSSLNASLGVSGVEFRVLGRGRVVLEAGARSLELQAFDGSGSVSGYFREFRLRGAYCETVCDSDECAPVTVQECSWPLRDRMAPGAFVAWVHGRAREFYQFVTTGRTDW